MSESKSIACLVAAREALTLFTDDELKIYTRQVLEKARDYTGLKGTAAISKAVEEVNNEKMAQMVDSMQTKINTQAKLDKNAADIKLGKFGLKNIVYRSWNQKNLANNVESAQRAMRKILSNAFFGVMDKDEFKFLESGENDLEIVRAIDGRTDVSQMAKSIAKKFLSYIDFRNAEMVGSDALSIYHLNKDRFLRAIHDRNLLINGGKNLVNAALNRGKYTIEQTKQVWRDFIKPQLNLEKTFSDTEAIGIDGGIDMAKVDKMLDEIYDNITTEKPEIFPTGGKGSQRMFFYWKNNEAMLTYAQKYGRPNLFSNIYSDVISSGNRAGMAQLFGDNPTRMFNELAEIENKSHPVSKRTSNNTLMTFKHLAGIDQSPISPTMANFGSTLRSLTSMKALGKVALLSLPDIANGVTFAKRWGFDYWEAYTTHMGGLFNVLPSEERQYIAGVFKEMTDSHMGYVGRFIESTNVPQFINNASTRFFRLVGMEALDKGNKVSSLMLAARNLGRLSSESWSGLPEATRKQFDKFSFTEKEWDVLRKKNFRNMFTVDNVDRLSESELRDIYGATSNQPLYLLKNELYRKVYAMFDVFAENVVLTPGAFMRATLYNGTRSGTASGELVRTIMQFKSYSLAFLDRVLYQGFKDADGAQAKVAFSVQLMGATLPMAFLSYWLNNIASGKSMPSWDAMNASEKIHYAQEMLLPGAGLLMSSFQEKNQNQNLIANAMNTPSMKIMSDALAIPVALAGGNVDEFKKAMKKIGQGITPGLSLPFIDPYLKAAMGDKAYLEPGQVQIYGAS